MDLQVLQAVLEQVEAVVLVVLLVHQVQAERQALPDQVERPVHQVQAERPVHQDHLV
jgi:hypothetical protein